MNTDERLAELRKENDELRASLAEIKTKQQRDPLNGMGDMFKNLVPQMEQLKKKAEDSLNAQSFNAVSEVKKADAIYGGLIKLLADGTIIITCTEKSGEKYFDKLTKKDGRTHNK